MIGFCEQRQAALDREPTGTRRADCAFQAIELTGEVRLVQIFAAVLGACNDAWGRGL